MPQGLQPEKPYQRTIGVTLLTLIILLFVWWQVGRWYHDALLNNARSEVQTALMPHGNALTKVINQRFALVEGLATFTRTHPDPQQLRESFDIYAAGLYAGKQSIRAIQIFPPSGNELVYPLSGNTAIVGRTLQDLLNDDRPDIRADIERAIKTDRLSLSGPYELRQGGLGLTARQAVFQQGQLWGMTVIILDVPKLLNEAGLDQVEEGLQLGLRRQNGDVFYGESQVFENQPAYYAILLPEGQWEMAAVPTGGWQNKIQPEWLRYQWIGLLFVGLLTSLVYLNSSSRQKMEALVMERTTDLTQELTENQKITRALRESEEKFRSLAESSQDYIMRYDRQFRHTYMNPAGLKVSGLTEQDIIGKTHRESGFPEELCTLWEQFLQRVLDTGEIVQTQFEWQSSAGPVTLDWRLSPEFDKDGSVCSILGVSRDISALKQIENQLRESEERYSFAQQAGHIGSWEWDIPTDRLHWSEEMYQLFGEDPAHFTPSNEAVLNRIFAEDLPTVLKAMNAALVDGEPYLVEYRIQVAGQTRWLHGKGKVIFNSAGQPIRAAGTLQDMTNRRQAEENLRESEMRYRELFESNPHSMWVYDLETLAFLDVNDAAINRYGYTREEFLSMTIKDIRPPEDVPRLLENISRPELDFASGNIWRHRTKDGRILRVEISSHSLTHAGRPARVVWAHDVTEQLAVEERIRALNAELEQRVTDRTARLEASNRELEAFAYSVSHDLRAPLRAIDGYSQILAEDYDGQIDDEGKRILQTIRTNTARMDRLIIDLLTLSRVSRSHIHYTQIDMAELAQNAYQEIATPAVQAQFQFTITDLPAAAGDPTLLRQVWSNLLSNAIKYTAPRPEKKIEVSGYIKNGMNYYCIKDSGVGFDPHYADKLFGVFQRLHKADEFEGTGVGLAIVQRIIQRHGGSVWATSQPEQGATFYFSIPQKEIEHDAFG